MAYRPPSLLSDSLLRHLMAAGQTDVLIGIPTLNNAATVGAVLGAVHEAVQGSLQRVLILNSDGGSDDGTPELVSRASASRTATVLSSHSLRTMHRILAPYHGLPGKRAAVRTLFAAADLLQARAIVIADAAAPAPSATTYRALLHGIMDGADFAATAPRRDPRERPLVSQVIRPLLLATFGRCFDDPTGEEFAASRPFITGALACPAWDDEALRAGVDIWLRVHALTGPFRVAQFSTQPRPRTPPAPTTPLREVVRQILAALWACLDLYAALWTLDRPAAPLDIVGTGGGDISPPTWNIDDMARVYREAVRDLAPVWREVLSAHTLGAIETGATATPPSLPDETWADTLIAYTEAWRDGHARLEDLSASFAPLYQGRAATVIRETRHLSPHDAQCRLRATDDAVRRHRGRLVAAWASRPKESV